MASSLCLQIIAFYDFAAYWEKVDCLLVDVSYELQKVNVKASNI